MINSDFHLHSRFSGDSKAEPEEIIKTAIRMGLNTICFTDHMDYEYWYEPKGLFEIDVPQYFQELTRLREQYQKQIKICIGIELGLRDEPDLLDSVRDRYQQLVTDWPFDFVIGSTHQLVYVDPVYDEFWEHRSLNEGMELYLKSGFNNIMNNDFFDSYGHLDYLIRYAKGDRKEYSYRKYSDLFDSMLKELIYKGKALEVNTKGLHPSYGYGETNPNMDILKRYKELGGELLTIGSDAHEAEGLAGFFHQVEAMLLSLGFRGR